MLGEINVRAGEIGDQGTLAGLSAMVQEVHLRERPDVFRPTDVIALEEWFRDILATRSAKIWIGQVAGVIAGYVLVREQRRPENAFCYQRRWYEIDQMGVDPRYQRQGVAKALLGRVIESAVAEGVKDIELNTWSFNRPAQLAFQKLGLASRNVRFGLTPVLGKRLPSNPELQGTGLRPAAEFQCRQPHDGSMAKTAQMTLDEALRHGPRPAGNLAVPIFRHGSLEVEMYMPAGTDPQSPHERDEVYVVARGVGLFFNGREREEVQPGSFIFVPARQEHRFESFSPDFAVWVFFYGPAGGEGGNDHPKARGLDHGERGGAAARGAPPVGESR